MMKTTWVSIQLSSFATIAGPVACADSIDDQMTPDTHEYQGSAGTQVRNGNQEVMKVLKELHKHGVARAVDMTSHEDIHGINLTTHASGQHHLRDLVPEDLEMVNHEILSGAMH